MSGCMYCGAYFSALVSALIASYKVCVCFHGNVLQNALWRKQMKSQVHNLQNLSDETVRGLLESLQLQEVLEQQQKQILDNQERMLQQGQEVCSLTCIPVLPTVDTHTSIVQLLPACRQHVRQPRATLRRNPQRICTYKHFNALGGIHILVGIVWLGATWFLPAGHFWLMSFYPRVRGTPFTALPGGEAYKCTPLDSRMGESK